MPRRRILLDKARQLGQGAGTRDIQLGHQPVKSFDRRIIGPQITRLVIEDSTDDLDIGGVNSHHAYPSQRLKPVAAS
jgi:hypothetical protein